jgi:ABC-type oligopeptide transport system ATPase subunit
VLLDCCYAGELVDQRNLLESTQEIIRKNYNSCLIAACRDFERAREGKEHGIFTDAVLKGLSIEHAKSINGQGRITSKDLDAFLERELNNSGQEIISAGRGRAIPLVEYSLRLLPADIQELDDTCPYQGLRSFDTKTAQFFFGRERVISALIEKLEASQFISVIGASGSGKSSVIRAGLIPELEDSGWTILNPIQPGREPSSKLKDAFEQKFRDDGQLSIFNRVCDQINSLGLCPVVDQLPGSSKVLLVVDQFEEVFTMCSDEHQRYQFIKLLTQVAKDSSRVSVAITLRADFLEPCLNYQALIQPIQDGQILLPPLNLKELEDAIVQPAQKQNFQLAEGLLDLILKDVEKEKNCLPLLQFALTELWQKSDLKERCLTLAQYKQMGGVTGALNQHAEEAYKHLASPNQEISPAQAWAKRICLRLVKTQADVRDTRRRRLKRELDELSKDNSSEMEVFEFALQQLIEQRLLVIEKELGQDWVDLTHEALMEGWKRFAEWREENKELRILQDRIEDAYKEWNAKQRNGQFLLMGGVLALARENWQDLELEFSDSLKEFYEQSNEHEQKQILERQRAISAHKEIEIALERQSLEIPKLLANHPVSALILAPFYGILSICQKSVI